MFEMLESMLGNIDVREFRSVNVVICVLGDFEVDFRMMIRMIFVVVFFNLVFILDFGLCLWNFVFI